MRRTTSFIAVFFFFLVASVALAQDTQPSHPSPEDAFSTRELIDWSYLQTPKPAPKPLPTPDAEIPRSDQQRASQSDNQLFVGKVVKTSGAYTLQASNSVYVLDGEIDARAENQNVRILGNKQNSGTIHVLKIERLE